MFKKIKIFFKKYTTLYRLICLLYSFFISIPASTHLFLNALKFYIYNDWITNFPSNKIRILYLKLILKYKIGSSTFIHMGCRFHGKIIIGNNSVIGRCCVLKGEITINNNVSITAEAYIFSSSHLINDPNFNCFYKPVIINDFAWIGARAIILPGVKIGKGAVLAAAAVATKEIPEFKIFAGVPAKEIGTRNSELLYTLFYSPYFE